MRIDKDIAESKQDAAQLLVVFLALGLCWYEFGCDVGHNTTLGDDDITEEFAQSGENIESERAPGEEMESRRTLRRFGWRVGGDEARYGASCYRGQRCRRVRGFQLQGIRGRQRDRLKGNHVVSAEDQSQKAPDDSPGAPAPTRWA